MDPHLPTSRPILAAIDGSAHSHQVASYAWRLAQGLNTNLSLMHVVQILPDPVAASLGLPEAEWLQAQLQRGQRLLEELCAGLGLVDVDQLLLAGPVAETICAEAEELNVEMIVVGAYGHGPVPRIMLGSVGDRVAALSARTVTIVR